MGNDAKKKGSGAFFLIAFGLPFALAGTVVFCLTIRTFVEARQMTSWIPAWATVQDVKLERHRSDDGTSYAVTAHYEYEFAGQLYQGQRVGLHTGADNVGDWHEQTARRLERHQRSREPVRCYVNPARPYEAVIDRDLRWGKLGFSALFSVLFGGVGYGLILAGLATSRRAKRIHSEQERVPAEPWRWKPEWQGGRIRTRLRSTALAGCCLAAFWNLLSMPLLVIVPGEVRKGNLPALAGLLFPLVGIVFIYIAVLAVIRWRRFGESELILADGTGVIGGVLAGVVRIELPIRPEQGFLVTLTCVQRRETRHSRSRDPERVAWQHEVRVAEQLLDDSQDVTAIPIYFAIPYECAESDETREHWTSRWELKVTGELPGVDYFVEFDVPVFRTDASRPDFEPDPALVMSTANDSQDQNESRLQKEGIQIVRTTNGTHYVFRRARNRGVALGLTVFWGVWTGIVLLLVRNDVPRLFPVVFGGFDLLLAISVLYAWFYRTEVRTTPGVLEVQAGLFAGRTRSVDGGEIDAILVKQGVQAGATTFSDLELHCKSGARLSLGGNIRHRSDAQWIADQIWYDVRGNGSDASPVQPSEYSEDEDGIPEQDANEGTGVADDTGRPLAITGVSR